MPSLAQWNAEELRSRATNVAVIKGGRRTRTKYSYDANGNAITRNGYAIDWTPYDMPSVLRSAGKTVTLSYGADRSRYRQVYSSDSGTETTFYVGEHLEKVTIGSVSDWRHAIKAGDQTVAILSRKSSGVNAIRYVLEDHQGSIAEVLNSNATPYVSESFAAFGARRDAANWTESCLCDDLDMIKSFSRRGYTGHEMLGGVSMGLIHMNGRVQDPITGRFLSADPYVPDPENTQSFNRYSYVNNNPLSFIDPSGYWGVSWDDVRPYDPNDPALDFLLGFPSYGPVYDPRGGGRVIGAGGGATNPEPPIGRQLPIQNALLSGVHLALQAASLGVGLTPAGTAADLYTAISGKDLFTGEEVSGVWRYAGIIPFLSEIRKANNVVDAIRHTPDQQALKELADELTMGGRTPMSREDAETVLDWATEYKYPGAAARPGDVASPSNWTANPIPHIHLPGAGRGGHVPVAPGVQPRP